MTPTATIRTCPTGVDRRSRTRASPRSSWASPPRCSRCRGRSSTSTGGTSSAVCAERPGAAAGARRIRVGSSSTASRRSRAPTRSSCPARPTCTAIPSAAARATRCVGAHAPRRPARLDLLRRVRARRDRACSTAAARRRTGATPACSRAATRACASTPDVLYVDGGRRAHLGRHRRRHRPVPAPRAPRPRRRRRQPRRAPDGRRRPTATAARRSSSTARCPRRPTDDPIAAAMEWALGPPARAHRPCDDLARRAHLSPRQFSRRFRDATGTSPAAGCCAAASTPRSRLLESSDEPVEQRRRHEVGFPTPAAFRRHFARAYGLAPSNWRRNFAAR